MAGALTMVVAEQAANPLRTSTRHEWQVQFARYFTLPIVPSISSSSPCPSLVPLPDNRRYRPTRGTWISTSSANASLHIVNNNIDAAILSVCFRGKILIQKFALRFSILDEVEIFINSVKALLEDTTQIEPVNSDFKSDTSCQSDFMSSNIALSSHQKEKPTPLYTPQLPQTMNCEFEQHSYTQKMTPNPNIASFSPGLPPSFLSLLNCVSVVKQEQSGPAEVNLKSQIVVMCQKKIVCLQLHEEKSYMKDSAFQDMLCKVEKVINEMGDDMSLKRFVNFQVTSKADTVMSIFSLSYWFLSLFKCCKIPNGKSPNTMPNKGVGNS